ncbi:TRAP transporter small permease [Alcaligenaceae bacterium]|nr:TRAP transporter small permease [Alcaligenaceae bacterium]
MRLFMDRLDRALKALTGRICLAAGWALLALSVVITVNVVLRKVFSYSLQGVDEYGGYCLAICASVGFSQAMYDRAHIRIDVLTQTFPLKIRAFFDVLTQLILLAMAILLVLKAADVAQTSHQMRALAVSPLRTPLSVPQGLWAGALLWFCFTLGVHALRALLALLSRDWLTVIREFGSASLDEEIEEEMAQAQARLRNQAGGRP